MKEHLIELIEQNKFAQVKNTIVQMNEVDIATFLEELERPKLLMVFRLLPKEIAADVFSYFSYEMQAYIVESITDKETESILDLLFLDDVVALIEEVPSNVVKKVLKNTDLERRALINQFLQYPVDSAGSIMTVEYVDLKASMTVKEALYHIKKTGVDKATINTCYVTDSRRILEGVISIRKLILSDDDEIVGELMDRQFIYAHTLEDRESTAALFKKYDLLSIPVVDNEKRLVGIVTIDDIVDIVDLETTEDMQIMAAMQPSEEAYLKTSVWNLSKQRIMWLIILMLTAILAGSIIKKYNNLLESALILSTFIPMLMATGGNSGAQSSTLVIRGLALGEIETKDVLKVIWKELRVGLLVGFALSVVNFLRLLLISRVDLMIALAVCFSLYCTVVLAKLIGGFLPILARKLKLDPAIMAGPLITTIVDVCSLTIFFNISSKLLNI
ncbi:MAG TPA: magnesium transporter [Clostridiaceae bacterium]|jgi:magnesium transporter|nr:magnesium transporter [Clostridiaceae bacterium]